MNVIKSEKHGPAIANVYVNKKREDEQIER